MVDRPRYVLRLLAFAAGAVLILVTTLYLFRSEVLRLIGVSIAGGTPGTVQLAVPDRYGASIFASGLDGPRFMAVGPAGPWEGVLFVAERGRDRVVALTDADQDRIADRTIEVAAGLGHAHALAFAADGTLLVAGETAVTRLELRDSVSATASPVARRSTLIAGIPGGGAHTTRTIVVGPDGRIFLSVGSSCNVCHETSEARAAILTADADGSGLRVLMRGLRNAVGLAFAPDGSLWATNNGRDWLGDDTPPETIYRVVDGGDAGWPRCHAGTIVDPEFGDDPDARTGRVRCDGVVAPAALFGAHMAPLGLAFWEGRAVVAFHGSWNRSVKVGYKAVWQPWGPDGPTAPAEDFSTGWLRPSGDVSGRPAGLIVGADGALYVSDDRAGLIYRIAAAAP